MSARPLPATTVALVVETNNLEGADATADQICDGLARLLGQLRDQTRPLASLHEVVITHDRLEPAHAARLEAVAGRPLALVRVARDIGYYQAKNLGFEATTAAVVAFADADCWPDRAWLERLIAPLVEGVDDGDDGEGGDDGDGGVGRSPPQVVAGRTTYRGDLLGVAATTIDFMYFPSPLGAGCTRNFYANNVAFRREIFAAHRYHAMHDVYRGHCQVLGLRLQAQGVPIVFEPRARTRHRFPDSARELLALRLLRGQDTVELLPHLATAYLPARLRWAGRLRPLALVVLAIRFAHSLRSLGRQDMPAVRGLRALACVAIIAGLSAVDAAGALYRAVAGRRPRAIARGAADAAALSYHQDRDRLVG
jgi:hypothetical protein